MNITKTSNKTTMKLGYTTSRERSYLFDIIVTSFRGRFHCKAKRCRHKAFVEKFNIQFHQYLQAKFITLNLPNLCTICHLPNVIIASIFFMLKCSEKKPGQYVDEIGPSKALALNCLCCSTYQ